MLVTVLTFWLLALIVFVVTQWVAPAFYRAMATTTTSFNFGTSFGVPFIKTWGLWVAGAFVILGPLAAGWQAATRGGEAAMSKALGTSSNRRGRR